MSKPKKHIDIFFSQAQEHHNARRFAEAKKIYVEILTVNPDHPDAKEIRRLLVKWRIYKDEDDD